MQANRFPPLRGWVWLRAGFAMWRMAPLPLTASAMTVVMCLLVSALIPVLGEIAFHLLLPVLGVGLFCCCQAVAARRAVPPSLLFANFGKRLPRLVSLAVVSLLGNILCLTLALGITGVDLTKLGEMGGADPATVNQLIQQVLPAAGWALLLRTPLEMAVWFAAPLIALRSVPLGKALFFSFVACWRNLGALLVFMVAFTFIGGFGAGLLVNLASAIQPALGSVLLAPVIMVLMPVFHAAFYVSARDIFGEWPDA